MKTPKRLVAAMTVVLSITPAVSQAQDRGPLPIREDTPGLLSQATISPAHARLAAFGEFPGAQLVGAQIRRQANRLVYSFDLKSAERSGTEHVQIDAATGQVLRVEYTVEQDPRMRLVTTAPPELVALVKLSFMRARNAVETVHVVQSRLRVEQTTAVYVFDIEVEEGEGLQQVLADARTGILISEPGD